jgi:DNA-binding transcriptional ArsR family regulator
MEDKITLDRESFKSLASDTRIAIIKSLDRRRKMLTELSKEMGMSPSTVKEHMDNLCKADLTVQIDDGHKWKYYELTGKGKHVLHPEETKIWILISISAFAMVGIFYDMITRNAGTMLKSFQSATPLAGEAGDAVAAGSEALAPAAGAGSEIAAISPALSLPYLHIIGLIIFSILIGASIAFLALNRKKMITRV